MKSVSLVLSDVDLVLFTSSVQVTAMEGEELSTLEKGKAILWPKRLGGQEMIG